MAPAKRTWPATFVLPCAGLNPVNPKPYSGSSETYMFMKGFMALIIHRVSEATVGYTITAPPVICFINPTAIGSPAALMYVPGQYRDFSTVELLNFNPLTWASRITTGTDYIITFVQGARAGY